MQLVLRRERVLTCLLVERRVADGWEAKRTSCVRPRFGELDASSSFARSLPPIHNNLKIPEDDVFLTPSSSVSSHRDQEGNPQVLRPSDFSKDVLRFPRLPSALLPSPLPPCHPRGTQAAQDVLQSRRELNLPHLASKDSAKKTSDGKGKEDLKRADLSSSSLLLPSFLLQVDDRRPELEPYLDLSLVHSLAYIDTERTTVPFGFVGINGDPSGSYFPRRLFKNN